MNRWTQWTNDYNTKMKSGNNYRRPVEVLSAGWGCVVSLSFGSFTDSDSIRLHIVDVKLPRIATPITEDIFCIWLIGVALQSTCSNRNVYHFIISWIFADLFTQVIQSMSCTCPPLLHVCHCCTPPPFYLDIPRLFLIIPKLFSIPHILIILKTILE